MGFRLEDGTAMWRLFGLTLLTMACWTTSGQAVEFKNVRAIYGPFGAPRPSSKVLPGDVVMIEFDIHNLAVDAKTGLVKYETNLTVLDPKGAQILKPQGDKKALFLGLGGGVVPERAIFLLGADAKPGIYKLIVNVTDPAAKQSKQLTQEVEVLPADFGFIHIVAPALGLVGQDLPIEYALVGFGKDKQKMPKITVTVRVLDESGKPTVSEANVSKIPEDMTGQKIDEIVRMTTPIFLNRPGRFTVEVEARDEIANKTKKFSYAFKVVEPTSK
jgi:hypothetical protein